MCRGAARRKDSPKGQNITMDNKRVEELSEIARKVRVGIIDAVYSASSGHPGGSLSIAENGFVSAGQMLDPGGLTSLSVTATDCRVVFLYAQSHPENICTGDMPCVDDVPRVGKKVMDEQLIPGTVYDLGVVLTAEGGQPVLLHARQDGSFALREISEALYVSILVERSNPVIDLDALPRPARELSRPSGEGWNGAVILKR